MDNTQKKTNTTIAMAVFFLGIFMGALDTGIISPARGVIASNLKVTQSASIWMVTIYTLVEAVSMPITGKLADRMGRKRIYITCIILFITGSILCWVSNVVENYNLLLVARCYYIYRFIISSRKKRYCLRFCYIISCIYWSKCSFRWKTYR